MRMSTASPIKDFVRPAGLVALLLGEGQEFRQGSRPAYLFLLLNTIESVLPAHLFEFALTFSQLTLGLDRKLMPTHGADRLRLEGSETAGTLPDLNCWLVLALPLGLAV